MNFFFRSQNMEHGFAKHMQFEERKNDFMKARILECLKDQRLRMHERQELEAYYRQIEREELEEKMNATWSKIVDYTLHDHHECADSHITKCKSHKKKNSNRKTALSIVKGKSWTTG